MTQQEMEARIEKLERQLKGIAAICSAYQITLCSVTQRDIDPEDQKLFNAAKLSVLRDGNNRVLEELLL